MPYVADHNGRMAHGPGDLVRMARPARGRAQEHTQEQRVDSCMSELLPLEKGNAKNSAEAVTSDRRDARTLYYTAP